MPKTQSHALIHVRAEWDDDAKVWVASSTDIEGLATEGAGRALAILLVEVRNARA
jgi:hypothetical protein